MPDDPDFIADHLTQLHSAGWSIGEAAFYDWPALLYPMTMRADLDSG
jgi:hypothetical protein